MTTAEILTCRAVDERLMDWLYDLLEPDEAGAMASHLAGCARCQAEADSFRRTLAASRQALPSVEPPPSVTATLLYQAGAFAQAMKRANGANGSHAVDPAGESIAPQPATPPSIDRPRVPRVTPGALAEVRAESKEEPHPAVLAAITPIESAPKRAAQARPSLLGRIARHPMYAAAAMVALVGAAAGAMSAGLFRAPRMEAAAPVVARTQQAADVKSLDGRAVATPEKRELEPMPSEPPPPAAPAKSAPVAKPAPRDDVRLALEDRKPSRKVAIDLRAEEKGFSGEGGIDSIGNLSNAGGSSGAGASTAGASRARLPHAAGPPSAMPARSSRTRGVTLSDGENDELGRSTLPASPYAGPAPVAAPALAAQPPPRQRIAPPAVAARAPAREETAADDEVAATTGGARNERAADPHARYRDAVDRHDCSAVPRLYHMLVAVDPAALSSTEDRAAYDRCLATRSLDELLALRAGAPLALQPDIDRQPALVARRRRAAEAAPAAVAPAAPPAQSP